MKNLLFVTIAILLIACKKDSDSTNSAQQPSTNAISGSFTGSCKSSDGSNYTPVTLTFFSEKSVNKMIVSKSPLNDDTLEYTISGNSISIKSQTFPYTGFQGGTYNTMGTGTYSEPQISLKLSTSYFTNYYGNYSKSYDYTVSK